MVMIVRGNVSKERGVAVEEPKKKNPIWDKLFEDDRLSGQINKELPDFLKIAIEHERKCIKFRLKQIESYLDRITYLEAGMDYFDTFRHIQSVGGVPFPKELYIEKRTAWEKSVGKKNEKSRLGQKTQ